AQPCKLALQPRQLFRSDVAHRIHLHAVVKPEEVHSLVIEAVPAVALCGLPKPLLVLVTVVDEVMLTRYIERLADTSALNHLLRRIKLRCLRVLRDITG